MIDVKKLNDENLAYIVGLIPKRNFIAYAEQNPKNFNKLRPGFRPQSLTDSMVKELLCKETQKGNDFVISFVESYLKQRLKEIDRAFSDMNKNFDAETAWILTAKDCIFKDKMAAYYALIEKSVTDDYLLMLHAGIKAVEESEKDSGALKSKIDEMNKDLGNIKKDVSKKESEILLLTQKRDALIEENKQGQSENERLKGVIAELTAQIKNLSEKTEKDKGRFETDKGKLEKALSDLMLQNKQNTEKFNSEREGLEKTIQDLRDEIKELKTEQEKNRSQKDYKRTSCPICPVGEDEKEFKYILSQNLFALGIKNEAQSMLSNYLSIVAFSGYPIVGDRRYCKSIAECLASSLTGGDISEITYSETINIDDIRIKIKNGGRIIYLDNFIGNYNETLLLPVFGEYRDKIIFVSAAYDKMFSYVSPEFLSDARYINIKYQKAILNSNPNYIVKKFDEQEIPVKKAESETPATVLRIILKELGFSNQIISSRNGNIFSHPDVYSVLAYEIFPYCLDIQNKKPRGEKLLKYLNNDISGSSQHIERWFYNE